MLRLNKILLVSLSIVFGMLVLSNCLPDARIEDLRGPAYAGSAACRKCHQQLFDSYLHTAHAATSSDSLPAPVAEEFAAGKNVFRFNDSTQVVMEKINGRYYQSYLRNGKKLLSHSLDIIVGSGRKAHTFLYYNDQQKISQLPISYFVAEQAWANSPGFPATEAKFDRNVPSYCLGCHSSFIAVQQTYTGPVMHETFEKNKIVYGIDCERCHGPALAHVDYYSNRPADSSHRFITKISSLNRVRQNDLCALCHSGFKDVQQSLFKFKPGDALDNFYIPEFGRLDTANLDVHGNQAQLMMASACFRQSNALTCNSCHNVHVKEREDLAIFSSRCSSCHQQVKHSFAGTNAAADNAINSNCIDCHMPLKASKAITMLTNQKASTIADQIRTHLIAIYPKESRQFIDEVMKGKRGRK